MCELDKNICIYGASSSSIDQSYKNAAFRVGELIAESGYGLVCGGGRGGLMAAAIEGALSKGGHTTGVLPSFMIEREWQHPQLSEIIKTDDMHHRKRTMAELSQAVIALPGGVGTLEELLEIITWKQLKLYYGNIVILNTDKYYNPLLKMLSDTIDKGFMRKGSKRLWETAETPEEALEKAIFLTIKS